jgi:hypothetical protein
MRIFTASIITAALSLGTPTFVQAQAQGNTAAIRGTDAACSIQQAHTERTDRQRQGPETGGALEGR